MAFCFAGQPDQNLADRARVLGEDQPQTLTARNNLAYAYESAGLLGEAIPLFERALADFVLVVGEDHPDTLTARHNLAGAYEAGRWRARQPEYKEVSSLRRGL